MGWVGGEEAALAAAPHARDVGRRCGLWGLGRG